MTAFWYLAWTPLPSAAVWLFLAAYLIHLERYRTWRIYRKETAE